MGFFNSEVIHAFMCVSLFIFSRLVLKVKRKVQRIICTSFILISPFLKIFSKIFSLPMYICRHYIKMLTFLGFIHLRNFAVKFILSIVIPNHHTRLETHENPPLKTLLVREENKRLERNWPIDLIWGTGDSPPDDSPSRHCNNHNISL
jgi:hypothetical protein